MEIATVRERLKALRRTKLYDLLTAAPLMAWFAYSVAQLLPQLSHRIALVMLFVRTDPSVLPASLVLRTLSVVAVLLFIEMSIVLYAVRRVLQQAALGFFP